eukprot:3941357-Alexandrium_andersonii.AAC.1
MSASRRSARPERPDHVPRSPLAGLSRAHCGLELRRRDSLELRSGPDVLLGVCGELARCPRSA